MPYMNTPLILIKYVMLDFSCGVTAGNLNTCPHMITGAQWDNLVNQVNVRELF